MHYRQDQQYEQHQTKAEAREVSPTLAVRPFGDAADERDDENNG